MNIIKSKNESRIYFLSHFKIPETKNSRRCIMYHDNFEIQSVDSFKTMDQHHMTVGWIYIYLINIRHLFMIYNFSRFIF